MKKRGEVDEEEEKDIYIGDEPDDGPTHYIMLGKGIDPAGDNNFADFMIKSFSISLNSWLF